MKENSPVLLFLAGKRLFHPPATCYNSFIPSHHLLYPTPPFTVPISPRDLLFAFDGKVGVRAEWKIRPAVTADAVNLPYRHFATPLKCLKIEKADLSMNRKIPKRGK